MPVDYFKTDGVLSTTSTLGGKVQPSMSLNFTNRKSLSTIFSCIRNSTATYYDGKTVAKSEENLLTWSQTFSNVVWAVAGTANKVSTTIVAPDGTNTALELSYATTFDGINQTSFNLYTGLTYTISFWCRRDSGSNALSLVTNNGAIIGSFTPTSTWARYSFVYTHALADSFVRFIQDRNASGFTNVQMWGAQIEQRSSITAYTPTTTSAITNYVPQLLNAAVNTPRFDHSPITKDCFGLLVEEQRTNLYANSANIASWTTLIDQGSILSNIAIAPDGTLSADQFVENTVSAVHGIQRSASFSAGSYTLSAYVKSPLSSSARNVQLFYTDNTGSNSASWLIDLSTGNVLGGSTSTVSVTSAGNNWWRISAQVTLAAGNTLTTIFRPLVGTTNSYQGNGVSGILVWGIQLEAGTFSTSYIPTTSTSATRFGDIIKCTDTSWVNPLQGTLLAEGIPFSTSSNNQPLLALTNSTSNTNNSIWLARSINNTVTDAGFLVRNGGSLQANLYQSTSWPINYASKVAGSYKLNQIREASNGVSTSQSSGTIPAISICYIGSLDETYFFNGYISRVTYYPSESSIFELEHLTKSNL